MAWRRGDGRHPDADLLRDTFIERIQGGQTWAPSRSVLDKTRGPLCLHLQENEGLTLKEIGERLGVSGARARQILMKAFRYRAWEEARKIIDDEWNLQAKEILKDVRVVRGPTIKPSKDRWSVMTLQLYRTAAAIIGAKARIYD